MKVQEFIALAQQQLERVKVLCSQSGLSYVALAPGPMGVGVAVGFSETDYVVLSILAGGNESQLMVTSGVLNGINQDRLQALTLANRFTSNNTAYPVYLHDAEIGWALLTQVTYPIELMMDVPQFFTNTVRGLPQLVQALRTDLAESAPAIGGRPWQWTDDDLKGLLLRSMM